MPSNPEERRKPHSEPFFVVGCGRSGTSIVQRLLNSHPRIAIPPETGYYTIVAPKISASLIRATDVSDKARLLERALGHPRLRSLKLEASSLVEEAAMTQNSLDALFLGVLHQWASRKPGAHVLGEKSPGHVQHIDSLSRRFPSSRFIHVIRDPRAVIASLLEAPFGSRFLGPLIEEWRKAISAGRQAGARLAPSRYTEVRYESLVEDPLSETRRLCAFVGADPSELPEDAAAGTTVAGYHSWQEKHMANTKRPVFTASLRRWSSRLSQGQVHRIEASLEKWMGELGYPRITIGPITALERLTLTTGRYANVIERGWRFARQSLGKDAVSDPT